MFLAKKFNGVGIQKRKTNNNKSPSRAHAKFGSVEKMLKMVKPKIMVKFV